MSRGKKFFLLFSVALIITANISPTKISAYRLTKEYGTQGLGNYSGTSNIQKEESIEINNNYYAEQDSQQDELLHTHDEFYDGNGAEDQNLQENTPTEENKAVDPGENGSENETNNDHGKELTDENNPTDTDSSQNNTEDFAEPSQAFYGLRLEAESNRMSPGKVCEITAFVSGAVSGDHISLYFLYDGNFFEYVDFTPSDGITVTGVFCSAEKIEIILSGDYGSEELGRLSLSAKALQEPESVPEPGEFDSFTEITDSTEEKNPGSDELSQDSGFPEKETIIRALALLHTADEEEPYAEYEASLSLTISDSMEIDNQDDLIVVSDLIDLLKVEEPLTEMLDHYINYGFGSDGVIDITDIVRIAKKISVSKGETQ